jgi:hypothetical protein
MSKGGGSVETPELEDYMPFIQAQQQVNNVDRNTPFGSVSYNTTYKDPKGYDDWYGSQDQSLFTQNQTNRPLGTGQKEWSEMTTQQKAAQGGSGPSDPRQMYNDYVSDFDKGLGTTEANYNFSPEIQSLFDKQFDPGAYDQYSDDYMSRYSELMQPDRNYASDRFEQSMFDRGQPVGGAEYGDKYRQTIGDPNSRQDVMAASNAAATGENARMQDFSRLMAALGGPNQVPVPNIDVMGPANMAMNANVQNQNTKNQQNSNIWNTAAVLGATYFGGPAGGMAASSVVN